MPSLYRGLARVLRSAATERPLLAWVKRNPLVLSHAIGGTPLPNRVVAEFPFGTDFRADFVAAGSYSGGWYISFVEFEPPGQPLFTKSGAAAKRLNGAIAQVDAWRLFIEKNRSTVLKDLSKFMMARELVWGPSKAEPTDSVGWPLYHPRSFLHWSYYVVIGRRGRLSEDEIERKSAFAANHGIFVMTYDRLLDVTRILDAAERQSA